MESEVPALCAREKHCGIALDAMHSSATVVYQTMDRTQKKLKSRSRGQVRVGKILFTIQIRTLILSFTRLLQTARPKPLASGTRAFSSSTRMQSSAMCVPTMFRMLGMKDDVFLLIRRTTYYSI